MLWGAVINPGERFDLASLKNQAEILKIGRVMANVTGEGESRVNVSFNNEKVLMARLGNEREEATLDLFFCLADGNVLSVEGDFEVTVVGYFEPLERSEEAGQDSEPESSRNEESESEEIILPPKRKNK